MKLSVLLLLVAVCLFSCGDGNKNKESEGEIDGLTDVVYSIDELYENSAELEGKEITVKGIVMHVCKQGGGRCFLMGSNENFNIRIEAGEKIGAFRQEQMGNELTIRGIFKEVKTAADAHNPSREHADTDHEHDEQAEEAHRVIVKAQERADVVYFMEGIRIVKEES